ncbi:uncharacterized protein Z518_03387 [Rhinocladiella mackenziei CBS 650.93]|uniref:FAD-binding PCMH-type domain-containing protein n=1 Tax=Rhinocladiella mackenziei CBS 650.93 TaxID=1442369 RepID=A0A0D2JH94_9EURO|nr:uncharacterized protein Z518_03387 [Rhinocladiella mackenziei CBS 650.93]KIX08730.1 hypothetical protein Z518_03387 [Rhinocladiella mackenziei CBS 650.93]
MVVKFSVTAFYSALLLSGIVQAGPPPYCKPIPGSSDWPSQAEWQALNTSISGRLIKPVPPGQVCQANSSSYSVVACETVISQWSNSSWHAQDPFTADYNDDACLPNAQAPCTAALYPAYVINATNVTHVQAGVKFAKRTGVRLIVKGTGHDIPGRSSGPNSLSIYTHNIRGIDVSIGDARARKYGGVAAVKIGAGMRMGEIYMVAAQHNLTIVGGGDNDVGIGGWITAAGHSPLSSKYGLGADQVLEMEVVTANGTHLTINENSYPGLFWAMRGGGGSTFAVMISVTVRAYPSVGMTAYTFSYNTTGNTDTFWSLVTYFHSQLPAINDKGVMGYYWIIPDAGVSDPNPATRGQIFGAWFVPEKSPEEATKIISPMEQTIRNNTRNWEDPVSVTNSSYEFPDFSSAWSLSTPESVGPELRLGSRLLTRQALEGDPQRLKKLWKQTTTIPQNIILGHMVAGPGVKNVKIPGGGNSVLPAWRDAYVHLGKLFRGPFPDDPDEISRLRVLTDCTAIPRTWPYLNDTAKLATTKLLRNVEVEALREMAPHSGAYINEADPTEPNWKKTFWGSNYPRLLELKNYWDPDGVFWCIPCVGHDQWTFIGNEGIEGGIGQSLGRICKTQ